MPKHRVIFKKLSAPISVQWEITPLCNYRCFHCYNYWRSKKENIPINTRNLPTLYQRTVDEIIKNRIFDVTITGGEPLLVFEQAFSFIKQLAKAGIKISLNSNLSLLTKDIIKKLKEAGIKSVLISLHADKPEINDDITQTPRSFKQTIKGIKLAKQYGFGVSVNMVVSKKNISRVLQTAKLVSGLKIDSFSATKASKPENCHDFDKFSLSHKELRSLIDALILIRNKLKLKTDSLVPVPMCFFNNFDEANAFSSRKCNGGKTSCIIGFDGHIRPCVHISKNYGTVVDGFKKAWDNMELWRTDEWLPKQCGKCVSKDTCAGGCKMEAYSHFNNMSAPDPFCDFKNLPKKAIFKKKKNVELSKLIALRINPHLTSRKESFGGIVKVHSSWVPVNSLLYKYIIKNKDKNIKLEDVAKLLNISSHKAENTVKYLYYNNILIKGGEYI